MRPRGSALSEPLISELRRLIRIDVKKTNVFRKVEAVRVTSAAPVQFYFSFCEPIKLSYELGARSLKMKSQSV